MRTLLLITLTSAFLACGGRKIEVQNPAPAASISVKVTNGLTQSVNVYVMATGPEVFVGQVAANSTELLAVRNIAAGSSIRLRAVTQDGARTFTREAVELRDGVEWRLP
ncbi:MAG: hypothetical protein ACT4R6_02295 [Gemmatimonadaceae bacterium]